MPPALALVPDRFGPAGLQPPIAALLRRRAVTLAPVPEESHEDFSDRIDTALMALWRDTGEEAAFEALYAHARDRVLTWLRWLARGERAGSDPAELLQDTFVNVYRYGRGFRDEGPGSFRAWVRTIAGNVLRRAASRGRSRRRGEVSLQDLPEGLEDPVDPRGGPHLRLVEGEEREALAQSWLLFLQHYARAYARLSPRDQRALRLVEVQGLTYAETCARLGVSSSNMKMIMLRARRRLQARMRAAMEGEREGERATGALADVG